MRAHGENDMYYYTGIGSRETPLEILGLMATIGLRLADHRYTLRSGGADGADSAFARGCASGNGRSEIYLPWVGFNSVQTGIVPTEWGPALALAEQFHPAWDRCSSGARKLHARNGFQVLGLDLATPSRFVMCWTRGGLGGGGTGQAIRIARSKNIPVYDLGGMKDPQAFSQMDPRDWA